LLLLMGWTLAIFRRMLVKVRANGGLSRFGE
jgi:hypothetical protein